MDKWGEISSSRRSAIFWPGPTAKCEQSPSALDCRYIRDSPAGIFYFYEDMYRSRGWRGCLVDSLASKNQHTQNQRIHCEIHQTMRYTLSQHTC
jgi:hypothetical protein